MLFRFICVIGWLGLSAATCTARADALEAPSLLELAEAVRPALDEHGPKEVRVGLLVTVSVEGAVTEVSVQQSAGEAFDAAAREALLRSRFSPARRDGVAIAARIGFEYAFPALPTLVPVSPDEAQPTPAVSTEDPEEQTADVPSEEQTANVPSEGDSSLVQTQSETDASADQSTPAPVAEYGASGVVRSQAEERRHSAEAVDVVDLKAAQARTADLGEVLARTEGVTVRRAGGLGSSERFSLVGFEGRQIRYFLDGIPLRFMGFGMGIANIPLGLVERVEIYRGVVPIRYGADAVGGAVDLVSDLGTQGNRGTVSYQTGSFGTHRLAASGRVHDARTGLFARGNGYFDSADNNYPVDAPIADSSGSIENRQVSLRNADYRSYGAALEVGVAGRKRARLATLRGFFTDHDKGIPHNVRMTVPYGQVRYGQADQGLLARYENDFLANKLTVDLAAGFVAHRVDFVDQGACAYDWFSQCLRPRTTPGEMAPGGRNIGTVERSVYLRSNVTLRPWDGHAFVFSLSPEFDHRETERNSVNASTLTGQSTRRMIVSGLSYDLTRNRYQNSLFGKVYSQRLTADERAFGDVITHEVAKTTFGVGDSLRVDVSDNVYLKASYEWATRMPSSDEYFGDGMLTVNNYGLEPERSHNVNLAVRGRYRHTRLGLVQGEAAVFARRVSDLIWLTAGTDSFEYKNQGEARSLGATANLSYRSPGDWVDLRGNASFQDFRNISKADIYRDVRGDRIPNRPYLEASGEVGVGMNEVIGTGDRLSALWGFRYVGEYFLAYESRGDRNSKLTIPSQFVMHAAVRYVITNGFRTLSTVIEAQNLANVTVYDFFGVQRPRRAVYAKLNLDF